MFYIFSGIKTAVFTPVILSYLILHCTKLAEGFGWYFDYQTDFKIYFWHVLFTTFPLKACIMYD